MKQTINYQSVAACLLNNKFLIHSEQMQQQKETCYYFYSPKDNIAHI